MSFRFVAASLALVLSLPLGAMANHIDFIQDDSDPSDGINNATFSLTTTGPAVTDTQTGDTDDILGGTRVVTLSDDRAFGPGGTAEKAAGTEFIQVTTPGILNTPTLVLDYPDILDSDFDTMWNSIAVTFLSLDSPLVDGASAADLTVAVESSAGNGSVTLDLLQAPGQSTVFFPFSNAGFTGVDFSDVDGVTLTVDPTIVAFDYRLGGITREVAIPEPASLALAAAASAIGIVVVGRNQRRQGG